MADIFIFRTIFCKDFKSVNFVNVGPCSLMHVLCLACLLNFAEQASWAEPARRGAWSYEYENYIFEILVKNRSKYVSASSI